MKNIALAIDIGASHLRIGLVNKKGKILKKTILATEKRGKDGRVITKQILQVSSQLMKGNFSKIAGIGIGSIGPLNYQLGGILESPNIPFKFVPLINPFSSAFGLPIFLLNDCSTAVWGEKIYGAGKKLKNLIFITISTGIGGGAIVDGHLLFGSKGNACEIGHQIVEEKYNFLCSCKKGKGHWEGIASGRNIPRFFQAWLREKKIEINFKIKNSKDIFEAGKKRNRIVLNFLEELAKINARAISNIILAYEPDLISFGGAVVLNNKELILKPMKKYIDRFLKIPKIILTPLGEDIVLIGAAALVFYPPDILKSK